jgi:hypothetical protein
VKAICTWFVIGLALLVPFVACQRAHTVAPLSAIDWRTSPLDPNLRGMNGKSYLFRFPAGKPAQRGGLVMIQILPGQDGYRGTMQNFIRSADYAQSWSGSSAVLSAVDFRARSPQ